MNPVIRILLLAVVVVVAGIFMVSNYSGKMDAYEFQSEVQRLKQEFIERGSFARHLGEGRSKDWRDESRALIRWYFDELNGAYNRHPDQRKRVTGLEALKRDKEKGKIKDADWSSYEEWYKLTEQAFTTLKDGKYDFVFGGSAEGLRLDVMSVTGATNPTTKEKALKVDFAVWGAPRRIEKEQVSGSSKIVTRIIVPITFKQIGFRFIDDKGSIAAEMSGGAEPYQKIQDPERWVEDFPPGILFGTWYFDVFPHEAVKAEVNLEIDGRGQAGSDIPANFKWELPLKDDWKLREGEVFKAETMEMPEEYIKRQDQNPDAPAPKDGKKPKTAKK